MKWMMIVSDIKVMKMIPSEMIDNYWNAKQQLYEDYEEINHDMAKFDANTIDILYEEIKCETMKNIPRYEIIENYKKYKSIVRYILDCQEYKINEIKKIVLYENQSYNENC